MVREGNLQVVKKGRFWFIDEADFENWRKNNTQEVKDVKLEVSSEGSFNHYLKFLLLQRNIKMRIVAYRIGRSSETARSWIAGESVPNKEDIDALILSMNLSLEESSMLLQKWEEFPARRKRGH